MIRLRTVEKRRAYAGLSLMLALGLTVAALIHTEPTGAAVLLSAASAGSGRAVDLSAFYRNDKMVLTSAPGVAEQAAFLRDTFADEPLFDGETDFSAYVSVLPREEAAARVKEINEKKEREAREERERAERAAAGTVYTYGGGYVGLNTQGIPMSQKAGSVALDGNGVPVDYAYCITAKATAYTADTITSTGTRPIQGSVAVDPRKIPYGTKMWITSADGRYVYGLAEAEDTGGFIYLSNGPAVDLYMYSEQDCDDWGWRTANIYILN